MSVSLFHMSTTLKKNNQFQLVLVMTALSGLGRQTLNNSVTRALTKLGYVWVGGEPPLFPLDSRAIILNGPNNKTLNIMAATSYEGPLSFAVPTKMFDVSTQYDEFLTAARELVTVDMDFYGVNIRMNPFGGKFCICDLMEKVETESRQEALKLFTMPKH